MQSIIVSSIMLIVNYIISVTIRINIKDKETINFNVICKYSFNFYFFYEFLHFLGNYSMWTSIKLYQVPSKSVSKIQSRYSELFDYELIYNLISRCLCTWLNMYAMLIIYMIDYLIIILIIYLIVLLTDMLIVVLNKLYENCIYTLYLNKSWLNLWLVYWLWCW